MVGKENYEQMLHIISIIPTRMVIYTMSWIQT